MKRLEINMWSSVMTPPRAKALGEIIDIVEACGVKTLHRQLGNITNDLRAFGHLQTLARLENEVEAYNEGVREQNESYDQVASLLARGKTAREKRYRIDVPHARQYLQEHDDDVDAAWSAFTRDGGLQ